MGGMWEGRDASQVCCIRVHSEKLSLNTDFRSVFLSDWIPTRVEGGSALNWKHDEWNSLKLHLYWSHTVIKQNPLNQKWEGFFLSSQIVVVVVVESDRHQLCRPSQKQGDWIISVLVWPISQSWRSWQPVLDGGPLAGGEMALFDNVLAGCCRARLEVFFWQPSGPAHHFLLFLCVSLTWPTVWLPERLSNMLIDRMTDAWQICAHDRCFWTDGSPLLYHKVKSNMETPSGEILLMLVTNVDGKGPLMGFSRDEQHPGKTAV